CPQCNTKAEVPDTAAGAKGKCRTCGAVVHVPGVRRKLCCSCGIDVTSIKRWKDSEGQYYCDKCWQSRAEPSNEAAVLDALIAPAASGEDGATLVLCPSCQRQFNVTQMAPRGECASTEPDLP